MKPRITCEIGNIWILTLFKMFSNQLMIAPYSCHMKWSFASLVPLLSCTFPFFGWIRRSWTRKRRQVTNIYLPSAINIVFYLHLPGAASSDDICITSASCCLSDMGAKTWVRGAPSGPRPEPLDRDDDGMLRAYHPRHKSQHNNEHHESQSKIKNTRIHYVRANN